MERESNTEYVLSLSYGKDSCACIGAIEKLGLPLDRIIHAEVWATDTIPADLPPMVEFKAKADEIIYKRTGIKVEHLCAKIGGGCALTSECQKKTYEKVFYKERSHKKNEYKFKTYGFPMQKANWCTSELKTKFLNSPYTTGKDINIVKYLGIASDEPNRIERHAGKKGFVLPLVLAGWDEAYCRKWCEENDLLSPIYTTSARGGCWFCHNQGVERLRLLRKNYPELWALLMKWDIDSPTTFKADGHTVHDFDKRFEMEDKGLIEIDKPFYWKYLRNPPPKQLSIFDLLGE